MGFGEFAQQRPHAWFKALVIVPTLTMVGVPPGPHVGTRWTTDGVRTVCVLEEDSGSRNAVDVRRGVAKRRMSGTTKHAAIPAFSMEEDDIGFLHKKKTNAVLRQYSLPTLATYESNFTRLSLLGQQKSPNLMS